MGTQALRLVEEEGRKLGLLSVHLEVERKNPNALALYKKMGFQDTERFLLTRWLNASSAGPSPAKLS